MSQAQETRIVSKTNKTQETFGLSEKTRQQIKTVFEAVAAVEKVVIYGSRAKGNYRKGSDIDLTLYGDGLTHETQLRIASDLDDLPIPYTVDLSIFKELSHVKLREHIERVGKIFYEKAQWAEPSKWKMVKLGDVCEFTRGLTYSKKDEVAVSKNAVLRATNVDLNSHKVVLNEIRFIADNIEIKEEKIARNGDILICTASGSKSHLGKVALVKGNSQMAFGGFMGVIRVKHNCLSSFLFAILISDKFRSFLSQLSDGANINNLKFSQIKSFPIPLPPLPEQKRIVAKLDKAFAQIEKAIAATKQKQKEVASLKHALLTSELDARKSKNAKSWKTVKLGDVLEIIQNGVTCEQNKDGIGYRISRIETIANEEVNLKRTGFSELNNEQRKKSLLHKGDVLFSHINSPIHVGKSAIYNDLEPIYHGINLLRLRAKSIIKPKYFSLFLKSLFWSGYWRTIAKQSVNQASVNQQDIRNVIFRLPPLPEQKRIVAKLDKAFAQIEILNDSMQKQLDLYSALKSSFLRVELKQ